MSDDEPIRARGSRPVSVVASGRDSLLDSLPVASGRARTRQLLKAKGVRVLRVSCDAGQLLGDRVENAPMLIQTLQGRITLVAAGEEIDMPAGAVVHLERQLPHSILAIERSHLMITLLGPRLARPRTASHDAERVPAVASSGSLQRGVGRATGGRRGTGDGMWAAHNLVLSATGANAIALDGITRRHAELERQLAAGTSQLLDELAGQTDARAARERVVDWARTALLPQLALEAEVLYPPVAVQPQQRSLVTTLRQQLDGVIAAVDRLAEPRASLAFDIAASAVALRVIVGRHLKAEAELLLPALAISTGEPLASLWERMSHSLAVPLGA
ncbi:hemerythrin domain-containing protein [Parafrigoribacterium soli]|uniref:hemerythrin domain-containing protein n=1 Tax=Parafrigoribacterium soli TaxID=3144663 RepID=UPI0032EFCD51